MSYETILFEKTDNIARITLNRPEKLNALSTKLRRELIHAIKECEKDDEVKVIIIKGAGQAFSSGYDINLLESSPEELGEMGKSNVSFIQQDMDFMMDNVIEPWTHLWNSRKPIISQVHGYCLAGGTDLVFHTDMIVCADTTIFGMPAARAMGTTPTHMWTYLAGPQWAKYILYTGNPVDGKTAEKIGLVLKSVPMEALEKEVNDLAERISKVPYGLLSVHKRIVNMTMEMMGRTLIQRIAMEGDAMGHLDPKAREFAEKSIKDGLKEALNWRDGGFEDYRTYSKE